MISYNFSRRLEMAYVASPLLVLCLCVKCTRTQSQPAWQITHRICQCTIYIGNNKMSRTRGEYGSVASAQTPPPTHTHKSYTVQTRINRSEYEIQKMFCTCYACAGCIMTATHTHSHIHVKDIHSERFPVIWHSVMESIR